MVSVSWQGLGHWAWKAGPCWEMLGSRSVCPEQTRLRGVGACVGWSGSPGPSRSWIWCRPHGCEGGGASCQRGQSIVGTTDNRKGRTLGSTAMEGVREPLAVLQTPREGQAGLAGPHSYFLGRGEASAWEASGKNSLALHHPAFPLGPCGWVGGRAGVPWGAAQAGCSQGTGPPTPAQNEGSLEHPTMTPMG